MSELVLWLFVVFSGIAVGAALYEARINVPRWFPGSGTSVRVDAKAMAADDVGRRFWALVTTGPLTLLTLASLVLAWHPVTSRDWWWSAAAIVTLAERAATLGYFIPTAIRLLRPATRASARAKRWVSLNRVRAVWALAAWLLALKALTLTH